MPEEVRAELIDGQIYYQVAPSHDYVLKLNLYMAASVREYWIVNPMEPSVYVYHFEKDNFKTTAYTFQDKIKINIYDDLFIDFTEIDKTL